MVTDDFESRFRASESRDPRFDGRVFIAVTSTRVYCRPTCPASMPKRENVKFYRYGVLAELAGYRPCRRCRPELGPDAPEWDVRGDLVGRALRLIAEGEADRCGVEGLAAKLKVTERHLQRVFTEDVGTTPGAVARSKRAHRAHQLLLESTLPITDVAFAAGFKSIRTFNDSMKGLFGRTPTELRKRAGRGQDAGLSMKLRYRPPADFRRLLAFLAARAIPGVEEVTDTSYRRAIRFEGEDGIVELTPKGDIVLLKLTAGGVGNVASVIQGARRLFDLDACTATIDDDLGADPALREMVALRPGMRLPGAFDGFELAVRAVLGQQVSVAAASTLTGRLARTFGTPLATPVGDITHHFPTPRQLANADLSRVGLPGRRQETIRVLAEAVARGDITFDGSTDAQTTLPALMRLHGIGKWTAAYIGMRALRDPDAFPDSDLALQKAFERSGVRSNGETLSERAESWRPWRGYAAMHLWASLG